MRFYDISETPPSRTPGTTVLLTRVQRDTASFVYEATWNDALGKWLIAGTGTPVPLVPTHWADSELRRLPGSHTWYDTWLLEVLVGLSFTLVEVSTEGLLRSLGLGAVIALYGLLCHQREY